MGHFAGSALCLEIKQVLVLENQPVGALCVMKFNKWKNALERFAGHESSKYHCDSVLKAECTLSIESGKQDSVVVQLNHQAKEQI